MSRRTRSGSPRALDKRTALGLVMFPHGAQKLLGWFGGYGFSGTMGFFTGTMHLPAPIALLVILGESVGALLLVAGLGTRLAAFGIAAVMLGAVATTHAQYGFFMNWFGAQHGEGFEYHLLALALAIPILIWGGGATRRTRRSSPASGPPNGARHGGWHEHQRSRRADGRDRRA